MVHTRFDAGEHGFLLAGVVLVERASRDVGLGTDVADACLVVALRCHDAHSSELDVLIRVVDDEASRLSFANLGCAIHKSHD